MYFRNQAQDKWIHLGQKGDWTKEKALPVRYNWFSLGLLSNIWYRMVDERDSYEQNFESKINEQSFHLDLVEYSNGSWGSLESRMSWGFFTISKISWRQKSWG